jgi:hypothetical protein
LSAQVDSGGCGSGGQFDFGNQYYLEAEIPGVIHESSGAPMRLGDSERVSCTTNQILDFELALSDGMILPLP